MLLTPRVWADAGAPPPQGAPTRGSGGGAAAEEGPAEAPVEEEAPAEQPGEVEEQDPDREPEGAREPGADETPVEVAPNLRRPAQREAQPEESRPRNEALGDFPPGRRDFLRRLRTTAENIEGVRTSEPTRAHTEGDLTVISNVASPTETTSPREPLEGRVAEEAPAEPPVERPLADAPSREVVLTSVRSSAPGQEEPSGRWRWLWVLGGLATLLLVPIAMLLTRATRNP